MNINKSYRGLFFLLLLSFTAFAFTPSFRQVMLKESKGKVHDTILLNKNVDSAQVGGKNQNDIQPPVGQIDTSAKKILMIGDSMLESFGPRFAAYALKNGHDLTYVIWYSSGTVNWGGTDKLAGYINTYKPEYIVVCLGGNELFIRDIASKRQKYVDNILSDIGDIPYIWVGPPNWKEDTGINDMLASSCKQGTFYLSKNDKFERSKDGAHPTRSSGALWCDRVCKWITEESAYPIRLDEPEKGAKGKSKVLILQPAD